VPSWTNSWSWHGKPVRLERESRARASVDRSWSLCNGRSRTECLAALKERFYARGAVGGGDYVFTKPSRSAGAEVS